MVEYLNNQVCDDSYTNLVGESGLITDDMMCAKTDSEDGVGASFGDLGTCNFEGFIILLDIISRKCLIPSLTLIT